MPEQTIGIGINLANDVVEAATSAALAKAVRAYFATLAKAAKATFVARVGDPTDPSDAKVIWLLRDRSAAGGEMQVSGVSDARALFDAAYATRRAKVPKAIGTGVPDRVVIVCVDIDFNSKTSQRSRN